MTLKEVGITFLVGREETTIELYDKIAGIIFARITLTPEQLSMALSRLASTPCKAEVFSTDKLNKKLEVSNYEFELPADFHAYSEKERLLQNLAIANCPKGWIPDKYFSSQNSFFNKGEKRYARDNMRRWVEIPEHLNQSDI